MAKVTIKSIINTSIVTAFTIAAALIWKDVITDLINIIVPPGEEIFYKITAAIIATILVIIAIYIILKTDEETESILKRIKKRKKD